MFVEKFSKQFGIQYLKNNNENLCPFPFDKGSGYVRSSVFSNGIEIIEINGRFTSPLNITITIENKFLVRMIFNMRWAANYTDSKGEKHRLGQFESILNTQIKNQDCSYIFDIGEPVSLFIVELDLDNLKKKFDSIDFDDNTIINLFDKFQKRDFFFSKSNYTLSLHNLILKFNKTNYIGKMRYVYQEAKITEIIIERFNQLLDDFNETEMSVKRQTKLHFIEEIAISISTRLENLGTIKEIAKNAGLSQQTLQTGFKKQFGCSVNQFVADLRLNRAIQLLDNSDFNMSEITYKLGLNSKSYFSKIFKEKFNMTPIEYRKSIKENKKID